jgi:hypothetical protein
MQPLEDTTSLDLDQLQAQVTQLQEKIAELTTIIEALRAENALEPEEVLNGLQRATLREYSFINHLEAHKDYYSRLVRLIERRFVQGIHVYGARPWDSVTALEEILKNDLMFNQYVDSRGWIGYDTRPLFAALFARLIISEGI